MGNVTVELDHLKKPVKEDPEKRFGRLYCLLNIIRNAIGKKCQDFST